MVVHCPPTRTLLRATALSCLDGTCSEHVTCYRELAWPILFAAVGTESA